MITTAYSILLSDSSARAKMVHIGAVEPMTSRQRLAAQQRGLDRVARSQGQKPARLRTEAQKRAFRRAIMRRLRAERRGLPTAGLPPRVRKIKERKTS